MYSTICYYLAAFEGRDELVAQEAVPVLASLCSGEDVPAKVRQLRRGDSMSMTLQQKRPDGVRPPSASKTMAGAVHAHDTRMNAMTFFYIGVHPERRSHCGRRVGGLARSRSLRTSLFGR